MSMRILLVAAAVALTLSPPPASVHLRVNQVGYRPEDPKVGFALTERDLQTEGFEVRTTPGGRVVHRGTVGRDRGRHGRFAHVYELDLSPLREKGSYVLRLGASASPPFAVAPDAHAGLLSKSLDFFRVQRCGPTRPLGHGECHLEDGVARGGPGDGASVRADGGWHDAGDYIKFLITSGYATHLMLATHARHPEAFPDDDANRIPDVLEEARVGIDWMSKLWDAGKGVLYYQVADASDHGTWRLPQQDRGARPVWAVEPGQGANVAGKAAASLALAAVLWNDRGRPYFDGGRASAWLQAARQIYAYGKERPRVQKSNPPDFYGERTFEDDMALAAIALFRATADESYLKEAREFARAAGRAASFSWGDSHALAHYELARVDPSYAAEAAQHLQASLEAARGFAEADPFRVGLARLHWGSAPVMAGVALQAFWYRDLTGDDRYLALGQAQWDYLLGANPWGVCFVSGAGTTWPRFPHHQIADLTRRELTGFWDEGPVPLPVFAGRKITLGGPDAYAAFQSEGAVYHDDKEDYVTNEPTLTANATGLSLAAWYVAAAGPARVLVSRRASSDFALTADPDAAPWRGITGVFAERDRRGVPVPGHRTEIRSRWTPRNLYLLFISPYDELHLRPDPSTSADTGKLWEWDVAEAFIGTDFENIRRYKEFQVSPQGEWIDLAIDLSAQPAAYDASWNSGYEVKARLDRDQRVWYGEMRIPMETIDSRSAEVGREMRINLYRIQGPPPDRKWINWQPVNRDAFHTPEAFGRLRLEE